MAHPEPPAAVVNHLCALLTNLHATLMHILPLASGSSSIVEHPSSLPLTMGPSLPAFSFFERAPTFHLPLTMGSPQIPNPSPSGEAPLPLPSISLPQSHQEGSYAAITRPLPLLDSSSTLPSNPPLRSTVTPTASLSTPPAVVKKTPNSTKTLPKKSTEFKPPLKNPPRRKAAKIPICFRCGDRGHLAYSCRNALVSFSCNRVGHRSTNCRAANPLSPSQPSLANGRSQHTPQYEILL